VLPTTERLALRRFDDGDFEWLLALYQDAEVTRYLGGPQERTAIERMFRSRVLDYYDEHPGLGMWVTIERASGRRAGFHLLNNIQGESDIQVGFVLERWAWGRGFATEMARAVLAYGFTELALPIIAGITSVRNVGSLQVLSKIGLQRRGERSFAHPAYAAEGPLAWFDRTRDDWLLRADAPPDSSAP
jgi:ribosomal-protein-alanine N-acetyltransferase